MSGSFCVAMLLGLAVSTSVLFLADVRAAGEGTQAPRDAGAQSRSVSRNDASVEPCAMNGCSSDCAGRMKSTADGLSHTSCGQAAEERYQALLAWTRAAERCQAGGTHLSVRQEVEARLAAYAKRCATRALDSSASNAAECLKDVNLLNASSLSFRSHCANKFQHLTEPSYLQERDRVEAQHAAFEAGCKAQMQVNPEIGARYATFEKAFKEAKEFCGAALGCKGQLADFSHAVDLMDRTCRDQQYFKRYDNAFRKFQPLYDACVLGNKSVSNRYRTQAEEQVARRNEVHKRCTESAGPVGSRCPIYRETTIRKHVSNLFCEKDIDIRVRSRGCADLRDQALCEKFYPSYLSVGTTKEDCDRNDAVEAFGCELGAPKQVSTHGSQ